MRNQIKMDKLLLKASRSEIGFIADSSLSRHSDTSSEDLHCAEIMADRSLAARETRLAFRYSGGREEIMFEYMVFRITDNGYDRVEGFAENYIKQLESEDDNSKSM